MTEKISKSWDRPGRREAHSKTAARTRLVKFCEKNEINEAEALLSPRWKQFEDEWAHTHARTKAWAARRLKAIKTAEEVEDDTSGEENNLDMSISDDHALSDDSGFDAHDLPDLATMFGL
jgi:hypothetical protein